MMVGQERIWKETDDAYSKTYHDTNLNGNKTVETQQAVSSNQLLANTVT
jgi:hypothetical protein